MWAKTSCVVILCLVFLAGCGANSDANKKSACGRVSSASKTFSSDVGQLAEAPSESSEQNQMAADTDNFKAALSELRGDVSDQRDRSTIDQFTGVLSRFEQAIEAASSENYAAGSGDLAGISDEIGNLNQQIKGMCS